MNEVVGNLCVAQLVVGHLEGIGKIEGMEGQW